MVPTAPSLNLRRVAVALSAAESPEQAGHQSVKPVPTAALRSGRCELSVTRSPQRSLAASSNVPSTRAAKAPARARRQWQDQSAAAVRTSASFLVVSESGFQRLPRPGGDRGAPTTSAPGALSDLRCCQQHRPTAYKRPLTSSVQAAPAESAQDVCRMCTKVSAEGSQAPGWSLSCAGSNRSGQSQICHQLSSQIVWRV